MESSIIYVALLDEGVQVWRPVAAEHLGGTRYRILPQTYDASDERWEFIPGDEVVCEWVRLHDGDTLVARRLA